MNFSETLNENKSLAKARILNRIIARTIDIMIVVALLEIIPKAGYFTGLIYLLIADGLFDGRSVGKRLIGLRVILCDTEAACSYKGSIIRNFPFAIGYILYGLLKGIPLVGGVFSFIFPVVILSLEGLILLGNEKGMRFGDEFAKTQVIEEKKEG